MEQIKCAGAERDFRYIQDYEIPQGRGEYVGIRDSGELLTFCVPIAFMKIIMYPYNVKYWPAVCFLTSPTCTYTPAIRSYPEQDDAQSGVMGWKPAKYRRQTPNRGPRYTRWYPEILSTLLLLCMIAMQSAFIPKDQFSFR